MTRTITLVFSMLAVTGAGACDFPLAQPDRPSPGLPAVPGAWEPCDGGDACLDDSLACIAPDAIHGGACTWGCQVDEDCIDLLVDEKANPMCLEGVCQLRCFDFNEECPAGMACEGAEGARICVWPGEMQG